MPSATPPAPHATADRRGFPQSKVQSARKERSSSSPALLFDEPTTPACPTIALGGNDGSASYRKAPESGIRGLPSCRSTQGLNSPAEINFAACLGGASEPSSGRQVQVSPNAMPELWVTKWVDYSSKYGVGYILSDGSIGVYFNDSTKIILGPEGVHFDYITRRTQEKPEVRTKHTFEDFPEDLKKKVTLLRHFRNYMMTDILEKKDGASVGESSLPKPAQNNAQKGSTATSQVCDAGQAPYVKKWTRNKHAIMFQLSNKIVQVVFFDKTEAVLSSKSHMVTYIDKTSRVCSYPLSNVLDVPSPELAKRLRYTKDILVNLLGARTSDLGGA
jgi:polo-like kinase 1